MNERILELAEQAKLRPALLLKHWGKIDALTDSEQKELEQLELFAELIVEECAKAVENSIWHLPRGYKATDQADFLKKHFGVDQ